MSPNNITPNITPNNVPEPTCVFSVCSCPPGWALHVDNMNNKRCIEAPQPQGKSHSKLYNEFDLDHNKKNSINHIL